MQICFFEDERFTQLHPLTLTRPVDDLRVGILTITEKWQNVLQPEHSARLLRPELKKVFEQDSLDSDAPCLWINARYLPGDTLVKEIRDLGPGNCLQAGNTTIAANVDGTESKKWLENGKTLFNTLFVLKSNDFESVQHPWEIFLWNGKEIRKDIERLNPTQSRNTDISNKVHFENEGAIFINDGVRIEAGCVLNAEKGPIYLGKDATVMAGSVIYGPAAICEKSVIKTNTTMYKDTTVGPVCKVGGEISNTVFHSYSNKAHDGYIGNSVVGQWCNFGAGTTVSNLKTNYSNVRVTDWVSKEEQDSGQQFLGIIMGDHSKTAINCVINSGTVCGVNCNILSRDFPPKFIPSFSWVGSNVIHPYKLEKALDTMEIMMSRRDVTISDSYKELMRFIASKSNHNL